jgi:hypothetical protein
LCRREKEKLKGAHMGNITFTLYDLMQMGLMLAACFACYKWGHSKGVDDAIDFFESEGLIEDDGA